MNANQILAALYLAAFIAAGVAKLRLAYWQDRLNDRRLETANLRVKTLQTELETEQLRTSNAFKSRDIAFHQALRAAADQVSLDQEMTGHRAGPAETLTAVRTAYAALTGVNWWPELDETSFTQRNPGNS